MEHKFKRFKQLSVLLIKNEFFTFLFSTLGIFVYAIGVVAFTIQYHFPDSGVMGISILGKYVFGFSPAIINLVINAIIFIWGGKELSKRFILYSLYNVFALSFFLGILEGLFPIPYISDMFLVSVAGGIVKGLGLGILFRIGASSGGMDIVAAVMRKRHGVEVGKYSFYINTFIIAAALPVVGLEKALFGFVASYISGQTLDSVLASFDKRRMVFIVTRPEDKDPVVDFISSNLRRGTTIMESVGGFTKENRVTIMCLLTPRQSVELKRYVGKNFPKAFMSVSEANEVLGNGFKHWKTV
ncbi:MAG: YitT family protein [Synergistaceae bacterium]